MKHSTRWWWLRHAPVPDPEGRIHGRLDLPCDTSETEDFAALARLLPRGAVLVESGLIRCMQTTEALSNVGLPLPPPIIVPAFVEQDFGHWQGQSWSRLQTAKDPDLAAFWQAPATTPPPGGESFSDMVERVKAAIDVLTEENPNRDIIAIAHAGTIRAALAIALDLPPETALRFAVAPLSLTRLEVMDGAWAVNGVNLLPG
ncbi:histidine phosphatase family protein [Telmatospirillum sp. J64-1]|uniref:histidine phosphatase family protein n=1 Tax=Telmatospirillum sp. J64-1 TaxID=2502183 RepID=UPI00115E434B|nr:histidine phosphatase family protein [Telmatospirillum sp. J64-1]